MVGLPGDDGEDGEIGAKGEPGPAGYPGEKGQPNGGQFSYFRMSRSVLAGCHVNT